MERRCRSPDLKHGVNFDLVREELLKVYGTMADDQHSLSGFNYVLDSGGVIGTHLDDLTDFAQQYVDPQNQKFQFQGYTIVLCIPSKMPRIRLAELHTVLMKHMLTIPKSRVPAIHD